MENFLAKDDRYTGFSKLINLFNYKIGVEVGTREGFYSKYLLLNSSLEKLYAIDNSPAWGYMNPLKEEFGDRFVFMDARSPDIADTFENEFFDFVYIDAWHSYEAVKADLEGWWPKLKKGGLFAGDDFLNFPHHPEGEFGVVLAVETFFNNIKHEYYVTGLVANSFEEKNNYSIIQRIKLESGEINSIPQWWTIK